MKVETKEDALLHCFDLWLWLSLHPKAEKEDWPGWKWRGGYLENCSCECPCCEYVDRRFERTNRVGSCGNYCPIKWTGYHCVPGGTGISEFQKWNRSHPDRGGGVKERRKWALEIAILALNEL